MTAWAESDMILKKDGGEGKIYEGDRRVEWGRRDEPHGTNNSEDGV
jgi:hypothetical protein